MDRKREVELGVGETNREVTGGKEGEKPTSSQTDWKMILIPRSFKQPQVARNFHKVRIIGLKLYPYQLALKLLYWHLVNYDLIVI